MYTITFVTAEAVDHHLNIKELQHLTAVSTAVVAQQ